MVAMANTLSQEVGEPNPLSALSSQLIELNYKQQGCDGWTRPRFWRLCGKLQRTPREMAALLRITPFALQKRLANGFNSQDGLLLTIFEREIDAICTGKTPTRGIFLLANLQPQPQ